MGWGRGRKRGGKHLCRGDLKGMDRLVQWRMQGIASQIVWLDLDTPYFAPCEHIVIEATDRASSIDLRAVRGLTAVISGTDASKLRMVASLCQDAGATRVITTLQRVLKGRHEAIEVTDTLGELEWKKSN